MFGHNHHTLANIWSALERSFEESDGEAAAKSRFGSYLVFDAVIGNTDRHHENWGLVRRRVEGGWVGYLAPSFDHASSLGRELQDDRREQLLTNDRIGEYSERGRGGIYWSESDVQAPSPLELANLAFREFPSLLQPTLDVVADLEIDAVYEILSRMPDPWMTDSARRFAVRLITYNCRKLNEF